MAWVDECKSPDGNQVYWTLERLRQSITDHFGVVLGINTIWVWLRKEARKLKVPRPRHINGDEKAQEAFKKLPELIRKRPEAEVFFFDEGRFGFKPVTGRRWARKGVRPIAVVRPGYQNFYVYSAISPFTGEEVSLFLPWVNTLSMNLFLVHFSLMLGKRCCFLVMDQAGWHVSDGLIIPANIELVYLPPYSPELNPVERLWQWLKRHSLRNRCHESLDAIMDAVQDCLRGATPAFLKSLYRCSYLLQHK